MQVALVLSNLGSEKRLGAQTLAEPDDYERFALRCPAGHPVQKRKKFLHAWQGCITGRRCDLCLTMIERHQVRWRCQHHCDFDVCVACFDASAAPPPESAGDPDTHRCRPDEELPAAIDEVAVAVPRQNGFGCIKQLQAVEVAAEHVAPFSLPRELLVFEPEPSLVVRRFADGDEERAICCNVELPKREGQLLRELQREARHGKRAYYPSVCADALRHLARARQDVQRALGFMDASQAWRSDFFASGPLNSQDLQEDLNRGIVYFTGRDAALRPTLVFRANRVPQEYGDAGDDRILRLVLFCNEYMLRYLVMPGKVETNCIIVDLKGVRPSQVPVKVLKRLNSVLGAHYPGRLHAMYVVNMTPMLSTLAVAARGVLSTRQQQKLVVVKDVNELRTHYALHQLEEDLGGSRPLFTSFLPFPMQPGPFEAGYAGGPAADAVPNIHEAFTEAGLRGRSWDPSRSLEDNISLSYSSRAPAIFELCGLPAPLASPVVTADEEEATDADTAYASEADTSDSSGSSGDDEEPARAPEPPRQQRRGSTTCCHHCLSVWTLRDALRRRRRPQEA